MPPLAQHIQAKDPPKAVLQALRELGLTTQGTIYHPLTGGRTNWLWRFASGDETLVCKVYSDATTPLFPNDSLSEASALRYLSSLEIAPNLCHVIERADQRALVYSYVEGTGWSGSVAQVAELLCKLHSAPKFPARRLARDPNDILQQGDQMLSQISGPEAEHLKDLRPQAVTAAFEEVLLHGDPVPSNIIQGHDGLRLIDWQCPAIGDPTEDLALFLSPAMQHLFEGRTLSTTDETEFLTTYGHPKRAARYRALAALYHWRMAAYCLWKAHHGDPAYRTGYDLEIKRL